VSPGRLARIYRRARPAGTCQPWRPTTSAAISSRIRTLSRILRS